MPNSIYDVVLIQQLRWINHWLIGWLKDAIDAMDGSVLDGRELRVQYARYGRPKEERRRSSRRRRR